MHSWSRCGPSTVTMREPAIEDNRRALSEGGLTLLVEDMV